MSLTVFLSRCAELYGTVDGEDEESVGPLEAAINSLMDTGSFPAADEDNSLELVGVGAMIVPVTVIAGIDSEDE